MEKKNKLLHEILESLKWVGILFTFTAWSLIVSILRSILGF